MDWSERMRVRESFFDRKRAEFGVVLNDVQREAVECTDGALLLLASPGSGKTTTMVMRIGYLIEERGVDASRVIGVTFSKASAVDMRARFGRFFPGLPEVEFSTIHSLAFSIVREFLMKRGVSYELIEGAVSDQVVGKKMMLRGLYKEFSGELITDDQLDELVMFVSLVKNKLLPRKEWGSLGCGVPFAEEVLCAYEDRKRERDDFWLMDYDDMLTVANEALEEDGGLLRRYQRRFDYVLTDESQDTSLVQHAIIEKLVAGHGNLCVVADDDQSIYGWRAAEPGYLLDFKRVYPDATVLMMEQNYRSSQEIVDTANRFIKRNKNRYEKNMFTENAEQGPVVLSRFSEYEEQGAYVARELLALEQYGDAAVLYRNQSSAVLLVHELERAGVPFYMKDADHRFFSHWVVEDVLNFMRLSYSDVRFDIFERIYMKMNGYITKPQMLQASRTECVGNVFDHLLQYGGLKAYQENQMKDLKRAFVFMNKLNAREAIQLIREKLGYEKALERMSKRLGFSLDTLLDVLNTLEEIAKTTDTMVDFAKRLRHLEQLMKAASQNQGADVVTLSTLHSSKGLEFRTVFMIDLVEGILPSKSDLDAEKDGDPDVLEEAARLFYVGMTRAMERLELLSYGRRNGKPVKASIFFANVDYIVNPPEQSSPAVDAATKIPLNPNAIRKVSELVVGNRVRHRVFGKGTILGFTEEGLEIVFEKGTKRLSLEMCLTMGLLEPV